MNRKGSISLEELLSLILGGILLVGFFILLTSFIGEEPSTDKSSELTELNNLVLDSRAEDPVEYSLHLDKEDLFLFYSRGTGPIQLEYTGNKNFGSYHFDRPEDCGTQACICYCRDGPYWRETEEKFIYSPQKILQTFGGENNFTCTQPVCTTVTEPVIFTNSRGSIEYSENYQTGSEEKIYNPSTLDLVLFTNTIRETNNVFQRNTINEYLRDFSWKNGYVLGGFGGIQTGKDLQAPGITELWKEQKPLDIITPPVTLRVEKPLPGIVGICIHNTCLYEEDIEERKKEYEKAKATEEIILRFDIFESKLLSALDCVNELQGGQEAWFREQCEEQFDTMRFSLNQLYTSNSVEPQPTVQFVADPQEDRITIISLLLDEIEIKTIEQPLIFTCTTTSTNGDVIKERPFSITATLQSASSEETTYNFAVDNTFCQLTVDTIAQ